jgi:spermidine synthase
VIIGDLVVPWRQGEGSLFTLEQFTAARAALAPGGLFCQWVPLFQLSEVEVNILARTFLQVFPHAQVWRGDFSPTAPAIAFIGSAGDPPLDVTVVTRRLTEMQPDPTNPQLRSEDAFWMNLVGELADDDLSPDDFRLNQEDRPWIELLGPMHHAGGEAGDFFTGRKLQAWLELVVAHSRARRVSLPARQTSAVDAGRALAEMTLCLSEGNRAGVAAAQERIRQLLPAETVRLLF